MGHSSSGFFYGADPQTVLSNMKDFTQLVHDFIQRVEVAWQAAGTAAGGLCGRLDVASGVCTSTGVQDCGVPASQGRQDGGAVVARSWRGLQGQFWLVWRGRGAVMARSCPVSTGDRDAVAHYAATLHTVAHHAATHHTVAHATTCHAVAHYSPLAKIRGGTLGNSGAGIGLPPLIFPAP
eukprot:gene19027-biopygen19014